MINFALRVMQISRVLFELDVFTDGFSKIKLNSCNI